MATIQGVYVALFGRPADPTGLAYFNSVTKNGADLKAIGNLAGQKEYTDRFTGMSNVAIINTIYQSLFNRDAEATGLNFFADALNKGSLTINNIATAILDGAQGDDKTIVTNKLTAAEAFTKAIDTPVEIAAYVGTNAAAAGRSFLATVTKDVSSIPNAAAVDKAVAGIATASSGGVTLSVTASQEVSPTASDSKQKSTAGDDTINVETIKTAAVALAKIDGGFGNDTVTLKTEGGKGPDSNGTGTATAATLGATPEYTNVEKVVVTAVGGAGGAKDANGNGGAGGSGAITLDVSKVAGLKELVNESSTKGAQGANTGAAGGSAAVIFNKIGDGVKLGLKGTITDTTEFNFDKAQTGTTTLALDKVKTAADVTITNGSSTVALTTANGSELTSYADASVKTLNISGTGALTLTLKNTTDKLATIDASALTGGKLTLDVSNGTVAVKITGTNAADDITLKNAAGLKDTIVYNKTEGSIYAAAESVTNFKVADDKLDLKALGLKNAGVQKLDNLTDGAAVFGTSSVAYYKNGNDTWVFADSNGDGKLNLATDFAVKLTGANADLTADNFSL